jgi:hypothetical protein
MIDRFKGFPIQGYLPARSWFLHKNIPRPNLGEGVGIQGK